MFGKGRGVLMWMMSELEIIGLLIEIDTDAIMTWHVLWI
jgi:hypothetical protein